MHVLAISGSLRSASTNASLLQAAALLAPSGMRIELYPDIGELPHFNPDLDDELQQLTPQPVRAFRESVARSDGLLISCPEYARGIPGAFKNALDWLVGCPRFSAKPVALFNASPRASAAQAALRLVLETMSARLIDEASVEAALLARSMDAGTIADDPQLAPVLRRALAAFHRAILFEMKKA